MQELLLLISFIWDRSKTSQQALQCLIFLNSSPCSIIVSYLSFQVKQGLIFVLSSFFLIIFVKEKLIIFRTILVCHPLISMQEQDKVQSILSAIYLLSFLHILEKQLKNLKIPISFLLFFDDGLLVIQSKSFQLSNFYLFCSYNVTLNLLLDFGLIIEQSKTEIFHFSRSIGLFNPSPLNLLSISGPILCPKETWKYLGFIFNRKLLFHHHINFYLNKSISTVKCMKILGNLVQGLNPHQKHLLYRSCILPIALYRFQLQYYNNAPLTYSLKQLGKIQKRAAIWISGAFKTSLSFGVKAIAGLIPINLHFKKLSSRL